MSHNKKCSKSIYSVQSTYIQAQVHIINITNNGGVCQMQKLRIFFCRLILWPKNIFFYMFLIYKCRHCCLTWRFGRGVESRWCHKPMFQVWERSGVKMMSQTNVSGLGEEWSQDDVTDQWKHAHYFGRSRVFGITIIIIFTK